MRNLFTLNAVNPVTLQCARAFRPVTLEKVVTNKDGGSGRMASIHEFADQVIDYGERLSDMADAAQGKGIRRGSTGTRWLILPAAGAGLFALVKSDFFTRQAKGVVQEAKTRASDLPDDLLSHVRQTSQASSRSASQRTRTSAANGTTRSARKRSSARKPNSRRKASSSAR